MNWREELFKIKINNDQCRCIHVAGNIYIQSSQSFQSLSIYSLTVSHNLWQKIKFNSKYKN